MLQTLTISPFTPISGNIFLYQNKSGVLFGTPTVLFRF